MSGDHGTSITGNEGTSISGYNGYASSGKGGVSFSGLNGLAKTGKDGILIIRYQDKIKGERVAVGYPGVNGIRANTWYKVQNGKIVLASRADKKELFERR